MNNPIKKTKKDLYKSERQNKDTRKFILVLAISVAALILAESAMVKFDDLPDWIRYGLALVHVPFTVLVAVYGWRTLMAMDELQRHIHMQSFVFGITAAAIYMLTGNLLNEAGLGNGTITWMFWPMLWIFYSLGLHFISRKY